MEVTRVRPEFAIGIEVVGCKQISLERFDARRCCAIARCNDRVFCVKEDAGTVLAERNCSAGHRILVGIVLERPATASAFEIALSRLLSTGANTQQ